jgi:cysteinyl-tRNA synthetase
MPKALQILWALIRDKKAVGKINTIKKIDEVFGLDLLKKEKISIPKEIQELVKEREQARTDKDYAKSDKLRDKIKSLGYQISDTENGAKVSKI